MGTHMAIVWQQLRKAARQQSICTSSNQLIKQQPMATTQNSCPFPAINRDTARRAVAAALCPFDEGMLFLRHLGRCSACCGCSPAKGLCTLLMIQMAFVQLPTGGRGTNAMRSTHRGWHTRPKVRQPVHPTTAWLLPAARPPCSKRARLPGGAARVGSASSKQAACGGRRRRAHLERANVLRHAR